MISLKNITRQCGANPAGILKLYISYAEDVDTIPDPIYNEVMDDIVMAIGKRFKTFTASEQSAFFNEQVKGDTDGKYCEWELSLFIPGDSEALAYMVQQMVHKRFVIIYKDLSDNHRILGSPENPLKFSFTSTTGDSATSKNGYVFTFSGRESRKAYFYTGSIFDIVENSIPSSFDDGFSDGFFI
jgi:hypothetical protein